METNLLNYPWNTIRNDGFLNFKVGDTGDNVLSKIKNLGLMPEDKIIRERNMMYKNDLGSFPIIVQDKLPDRIMKMVFSFNNKNILHSIEVHFHPKLTIKGVSTIVTAVLGNPSRTNYWDFNCYYVSLCSLQGLPVLSFDYNPYLINNNN